MRHRHTENRAQNQKKKRKKVRRSKINIQIHERFSSEK